ncbi:MliC family protein [Gilvimarinus sp. SDUM040013]|uniref:MliC family protein n=1 Tax=Gilvimarinus gilvus TaxID=3058038 RepID=A0ABU4RVF2_9GAMM|nr:MliC family protein [Gilvimarinus sp. SDUM040013]MDO3388484.1 MliC family protein [Gilvimarinus sp. SDUM040013]MDX6848644.1 MliC family protein [Gilvimarinus sp. SDUM040013]
MFLMKVLLSFRFIIGCCAIGLLAACSSPLPNSQPPGGITYDANSWKSILDASCTVYFDGCNQCRRAEGADVGVCTRKACAAYQKPYCFDNKASSHEKRTYSCKGGEQFMVFTGEYRADDMRIQLDDDEVWLSDRQSHTAYRLKRVEAASGEKYTDGQFVFWSKGGDALVQVAGEVLYRGCRY